jgi:branched-chain amino acid transport system permease protein
MKNSNINNTKTNTKNNIKKNVLNPTRQFFGFASLRWWLLAVSVVWVLNSILPDLMGPYYFQILVLAGINVILAVSLNLVNGFTGQFSMGHAGFMSVGGYISAYITTQLVVSHPDMMNDSLFGSAVFLGSLLLGGLGATCTGYLVGLPSLRLRGDYLAIVTLGFGEIIRVVFLNMDAVGGARGLSGIMQFSSFGWVFTIAIITVFTVWRVIHSAQGRVLLSIREDEIAATAMGVNTTQGKVRAFAMGAFFAGIAGGLFAHYLTIMSPGTFDFNRSFEIIIMVVLGGMGSISGSVVAAILLTSLKEALRPLQQLTGVDLRMVIYSLVLITMMLARPAGIFGTREIGDIYRAWRAGKAPKEAKNSKESVTSKGGAA